MLNFNADLRRDTGKDKQVPSPTGVIEACLEDLISGSVSSESSEEEQKADCSRAKSNWSRFFQLWKKKSLKHLASFTPLPVPRILTRKSRSARENPALREFFKFKSSLETFTLAQLETASNNFSPGICNIVYSRNLVHSYLHRDANESSSEMDYNVHFAYECLWLSCRKLNWKGWLF